MSFTINGTNWQQAEKMSELTEGIWERRQVLGLGNAVYTRFGEIRYLRAEMNTVSKGDNIQILWGDMQKAIEEICGYYVRSADSNANGAFESEYYTIDTLLEDAGYPDGWPRTYRNSEGNIAYDNGNVVHGDFITEELIESLCATLSLLKSILISPYSDLEDTYRSWDSLRTNRDPEGTLTEDAYSYSRYPIYAYQPDNDEHGWVWEYYYTDTEEGPYDYPLSGDPEVNIVGATGDLTAYYSTKINEPPPWETWPGIRSLYFSSSEFYGGSYIDGTVVASRRTITYEVYDENGNYSRDIEIPYWNVAGSTQHKDSKAFMPIPVIIIGDETRNLPVTATIYVELSDFEDNQNDDTGSVFVDHVVVNTSTRIIGLARIEGTTANENADSFLEAENMYGSGMAMPGNPLTVSSENRLGLDYLGVTRNSRSFELQYNRWVLEYTFTNSN